MNKLNFIDIMYLTHFSKVTECERWYDNDCMLFCEKKNYLGLEKKIVKSNKIFLLKLSLISN